MLEKETREPGRKEIPGEIIFQEEVIEHLHFTLNNLRELLSPVISPPKSDERKDDAIISMTTEYGQTIRDNTTRIEFAIERLKEMIDCTEL